MKKLMLLLIILLNSQVSWSMSSEQEKMLAELEADYDASTPKNAALFWAETATEAQAALDSGANINARYRNVGTALHRAVLWNHVDIVQLLLDRGADIKAKGLDGNTALDEARELYGTSYIQSHPEQKASLYKIIQLLEIADPEDDSNDSDEKS